MHVTAAKPEFQEKKWHWEGIEIYKSGSSEDDFLSSTLMGSLVRVVVEDWLSLNLPRRIETLQNTNITMKQGLLIKACVSYKTHMVTRLQEYVFINI